MSEQIRDLPELTCKELVEMVSDYIENVLPPEDYARVVEHLAGCDGCDRYVQQMQETIGALAKLKEEDASPQIKEKLREMFRGWRKEIRD